ncbi:protein of unknown function [Sterolibacterium denitrificans]|uniref:Capsid protein n=2 Tax=Sterolibacterium denitrificans TaxID=157592 RepID=A0A7Z7HST8_9PROT|nr:protein of unknown function [Sterolibacterium denitrificans]
MYNASASITSICDAIGVRAGVISPAAAHPKAIELLDDRQNNKLLPMLAAGCVARMPNASERTSGFGTKDFGNTLANVFKSVTLRKRVGLLDHRLICDMRELPDFREHTFPNLDTDIHLDEKSEGGETSSDVSLSDQVGLKAGLASYTKRIFISRQVLVDDDVELIAGLAANVGAAAARREAEKVYALLEGNPVLDDGEYMFHAGMGNIVGSAFSENALGSAMAALRNQITPAGAIANLGTKNLVVASDLEFAARKLIHESGLGNTVYVVVSPWLANGRWYLTADPNLSPAVGLMHLEGSGGNVFVGYIAHDKQRRDGVLLAVAFDFGTVALGRVGIVRGGA